MDSLYVTLIKLPILNTYSLFYVCLHSSTPGLRHIRAATKPVWCNYWSPHILEPVSATRKATVIRSPSIAIRENLPQQRTPRTVRKKKKNPTRQFNLFLVKWGSEAVFVFGGAGSSMKCGSSSSKCTAFSSNGALAQLPHSIWDPGSPTRDRIHRIHNLWTTREVPSEV